MNFLCCFCASNTYFIDLFLSFQLPSSDNHNAHSYQPTHKKFTQKMKINHANDDIYSFHAWQHDQTSFGWQGTGLLAPPSCLSSTGILAWDHQVQNFPGIPHIASNDWQHDQASCGLECPRHSDDKHNFSLGAHPVMSSEDPKWDHGFCQDAKVLKDQLPSQLSSLNSSLWVSENRSCFEYSTKISFRYSFGYPKDILWSNPFRNHLLPWDQSCH